jgi:hypothetical protein
LHTICFTSNHEYVSLIFDDDPVVDTWLESSVEVSVSGFKGTLKPMFEFSDLLSFTHELRSLYESLKGEAKLSPR